MQNQRYVANFADKNLSEHDLMNKCSTNEYDSFKNVIQASITNNETWAIPKLFIA